MKIKIKFKKEDCWIGCYWEKIHDSWKIWVCLIPCLPICISIKRDTRPNPLKEKLEKCLDLRAQLSAGYTVTDEGVVGENYNKLLDELRVKLPKQIKPKFERLLELKNETDEGRPLRSLRIAEYRTILAEIREELK